MDRNLVTDYATLVWSNGRPETFDARHTPSCRPTPNVPYCP